MYLRALSHAFLLSLICFAAAAEDITLDRFTDDIVAGSLREATIRANTLSGTDKITLAAGEYVLTIPFDGANAMSEEHGDLDITRSGGTLTIQGAGINKTIIRSTIAQRVLNITNANAKVILRDLTIADGVATAAGAGSRGGGVNSVGELTLQNVRITNCTANTGGGVRCAAALVIENCIIDENSAVGANGSDGAPESPSMTPGLNNPATSGGFGAGSAGGGIFAGDALTITDSIIANNEARAGSGGTGGVGGLMFAGGPGGGGNEASGGGIYSSTFASVTITLTRCTVEGNESKGGAGGNGGVAGLVGLSGSGGTGGNATGAGLYTNMDLTLQDCTISGNVATSGKGGNAGVGTVPGTSGAGGECRGGGIQTTAIILLITQCTFSGNTAAAGGTSVGPPAESFGGGLEASSSLVQIRNCTFTENTAGEGGGISLISANNPLFTSNIVAKNSAPFAPDFAVSIPLAQFDLDHCLIGDPSSSPVLITPAVFVGAGNLIGTSAAPLDPLLGTLKNNGGPTKTQLPKRGSPAINTGAADVSLTNDQRGVGFSRSLNGVDIGAVEAFPPVLGSVSATPTTAGIGQTISFTASATGLAPITLAWNFGDGSSGDGASVQHAYATAGVFTATVTATDVNGDTISATLTLTIKAPTVGTGIDSDGDGFSDAFETSVGTSPTDAADTPAGAGSATGTTALTVTKAAIKLNFAKGGGDSISFSGTLPVPAGFVLAEKSVAVDAGGVARVLTFSAQGKLPKGNDSLKLTLKAKKKVVLEQAAKYAFVLGKGTFKDTLADEQLTADESVSSQARSILLTVVFNGVVYQKTQPLSYTAKKGKTGSAK